MGLKEAIKRYYGTRYHQKLVEGEESLKTNFKAMDLAFHSKNETTPQIMAVPQPDLIDKFKMSSFKRFLHARREV